MLAKLRELLVLFLAVDGQGRDAILQVGNGLVGLDLLRTGGLLALRELVLQLLDQVARGHGALVVLDGRVQELLHDELGDAAVVVGAGHQAAAQVMIRHDLRLLLVLGKDGLKVILERFLVGRGRGRVGNGQLHEIVRSETGATSGARGVLLEVFPGAFCQG